MWNYDSLQDVVDQYSFTLNQTDVIALDDFFLVLTPRGFYQFSRFWGQSLLNIILQKEPDIKVVGDRDGQELMLNCIAVKQKSTVTVLRLPLQSAVDGWFRNDYHVPAFGVMFITPSGRSSTDS